MKKNGLLIVALILVASMALAACAAPAADTSELEAQVADLQSQLEAASDDEALADLEAQIAALQDQLDEAASPAEEEAPAEEAAGAKTYADMTMCYPQLGAESDWRTANSASFKSTADELGFTLIFSDAQQKQENQISAMRACIQQGVDVIALPPVVDMVGTLS
jgi:ABC-type sugar transport system substrate-binding protein